jgi:DNA repair protein RadC
MSPAEILRTAVILDLKSVLLIRNHPSGKSKPSQAYINFTKRVFEAAEVMDINVLDHVIIGLDNFTSLQQIHSLTYSTDISRGQLNGAYAARSLTLARCNSN